MGRFYCLNYCYSFRTGFFRGSFSDRLSALITKTIVTIMAWMIFGILLLGHHFLGWRGRFAARWTVIGFTLLMLSYFGVRFVQEVIQ